MDNDAMIEALTNALSQVDGGNLAQRLESVKISGGERLGRVAGPTTLDEVISIAKRVPPGPLEQEVAAALADIDQIPLLREKVVQALPFLGMAVAFLGLTKHNPASPTD